MTTKVHPSGESTSMAIYLHHIRHGNLQVCRERAVKNHGQKNQNAPF